MTKSKSGMFTTVARWVIPHTKRASQYCDYHLYISPRITSIKAPMLVYSNNRLAVILSHYDSSIPDALLRVDLTLNIWTLSEKIRKHF